MTTPKQWTWITKNRRPKRPPFQPIGEVLRGFKEGSLLRQSETQSVLERAVGAALGPELAGHVRPGGVRAGKLVLFVDDPAYRHDVENYAYDRLLEAVRREAPGLGVYDLQFKLDSGAAADRSRPQA